MNSPRRHPRFAVATTRICLAALLLAMGPIATAEPEISGSPSDIEAFVEKNASSVYITGTAEKVTDADHAFVVLSFEIEDKSMRDALVGAQKIRQDLLGNLAQAGFGDDQMIVSRFGSTPDRSKFSGKTKGYSIANQIRVKIRSEDELLQLAGILDRSPSIEFDGMTREHSQQSSLQSEALRMALNDVNSQRKVIEETLNANLIPIQVEMPTPISTQGLPRVRTGMMAIGGGTAPSMIGKFPNTMQVITGSLGELRYRATVTVKFLIDHEP